MELLWTGGVDRSGAVNEGPAITPVDGACAFPFVVGNEPESAIAGLVCPKIEPVCRVGGRLGLLMDSFCMAATIVCSVDSSSSLT